ncbi:ornithine--oxo-acid transaminase [Streptomyces sporangiiformans]|uniref:ornithine aminotransferase n=1 Tax=Streptomyces sporangiiformans TaxID=2315329 RepID=A0A505D6Z9_9ACTN|nr:ornithine--oxo-acid transaminase [Streptomyces sporangiiformans]TPQ18360.1 ornithine--oxo-acid transaminase [Streptomyces sporangiiformans]
MTSSSTDTRLPGVATEQAIHVVESHSAANYSPLPVVVREGEEAWVWDVEGNRYLDMLAGYGALNFGHRHPALIAAAQEQLERLTLTSRAFHSDQLGVFCTELAELCGMDLVLPMNTGAEAVETALKMARKWGYQVKGIPEGRAKIIVAGGNFHGRTISVISFSDDAVARRGFGPYTPGFVSVSYGDAEQLEAAIDDDTAAVLIEPVQGEGGVVIPPAGYLATVRRLCTRHNILMLADEIQSGLGRTGTTFACDHEGVTPDAYILGKALGGGILPVSAVVSTREALGVFRPGEHGSTFGGNPLASAVGTAVVRLLKEGTYQERSAQLGTHLEALLRALPSEHVSAVRCRGLWAGVDVIGRVGRDVCMGLLRRGVLAKDTHGSTVRLAPPLVVKSAELQWAVEQLAAVLAADDRSDLPPEGISPSAVSPQWRS